MKKWRVLVSAPYMQPVLEDYRGVMEARGAELVVPYVSERLEESDLVDLVDGIHGAICGDDRFTERVLKRATAMRVISKWGTGVDSIDLEAAARLGIEVCNTSDAFTDAVADSVLGYALCFARQLPWMDSDVKSGSWSKKRKGRSLRECVLGVVGVGNVGSAVVRRASAFGMRILGADPVTPSRLLVDEHGLECVPLVQLLEVADFVSLNCDLNATSRNLIGARELAQMKRESVLINTARGPLVVEGDLVAALQDNVIAGAALDVFEAEPLPSDSPLRRMSNVLLAPHNANSSPSAWQRVHSTTIENLFRVLEASNG
jgi:D-3-phosphoglycerate dehydrogenase